MEEEYKTRETGREAYLDSYGQGVKDLQAIGKILGEKINPYMERFWGRKKTIQKQTQKPLTIDTKISSRFEVLSSSYEKHPDMAYGVFESLEPLLSQNPAQLTPEKRKELVKYGIAIGAYFDKNEKPEEMAKAFRTYTILTNFCPNEIPQEIKDLREKLLLAYVGTEEPIEPVKPIITTKQTAQKSETEARQNFVNLLDKYTLKLQKEAKVQEPEELTRQNDGAVSTYMKSIYEAIETENYEHVLGLTGKLVNYIEGNPDKINLESKAFLGNKLEVFGKVLESQGRNIQAPRAYELADKLGDDYAAKSIERLKPKEEPKKEVKPPTIEFIQPYVPTFGKEIVFERVGESLPAEQLESHEKLEETVKTNGNGNGLKKKAGKCLDVLNNLAWGEVDLSEVYSSILELGKILKQNPKLIEGNELFQAIYLTKKAGNGFLGKSKSGETKKDKTANLRKAFVAYQLAALMDGEEEKNNYEKFKTTYLTGIKELILGTIAEENAEGSLEQTLEEPIAVPNGANEIDKDLIYIANCLSSGEQKTRDEGVTAAVRLEKKLEEKRKNPEESFVCGIENVVEVGIGLIDRYFELYESGKKSEAAEIARLAYVLGYSPADEIYNKLKKELEKEKPAVKEKTTMIEKVLGKVLAEKPKEQAEKLHPLLRNADFENYLEKMQAELRKDKGGFPGTDTVLTKPAQETKYERHVQETGKDYHTATANAFRAWLTQTKPEAYKGKPKQDEAEKQPVKPSTSKTIDLALIPLEFSTLSPDELNNLVKSLLEKYGDNPENKKRITGLARSKGWTE